MGHSILTQKKVNDMVDCSDEKFVWTYVSPKFPMAQVINGCAILFHIFYFLYIGYLWVSIILLY